MAGLTCDCTGGHGFTPLAVGVDFWVCEKCSRPTRAYLRGAFPRRPVEVQGGPRAYTCDYIEQILEDSKLSSHYAWVPGIVYPRLYLRFIDPTTKEHPMTDTPTETETETVNVSEGLLQRRKDLGLSREKVATLTGLTNAKVSRIEAGGARTTAEEAQLLRDAYDKHEVSDPS